MSRIPTMCIPFIVSPDRGEGEVRMPRGSGISADERGYNGWPNYETWLVTLWLGNDPATDATCRALAAEVSSAGEAAEALKELVEEGSPFREQSGLYIDLLGAALARVDWRTLAEHYRRG